MFKNKIVVAIDKNNLNEATQLCSELKNDVGCFKLGLEFFYSFGAEGINKIAQFNVPIFLDLKLHDIPNTVSKAVYSLISNLNNIDILTLHLSGGESMIQKTIISAQEASVKFSKKNPDFAGVTILTSTHSSTEHLEGQRVMFPFALGALRGINKINKLKLANQNVTDAIQKLQLMIHTANNTLNYWIRMHKEEAERVVELNKNPLMKELDLELKCAVGTNEFYKKNSWEGLICDVITYANIANKLNLTYVVTSPLEVKFIKAIFPNLKVITPGVRPLWYDVKDDQSRTLTPKEAIAEGSDLLVIGRPITSHSNPLKATRKILEEISA